VQNDTSKYEIPAEKLVYTHEGLAERSEMGAATVVTNFWGKAKIQIGDQRDTSSLKWIAAFILLAAALATAWFLHVWPFPGEAATAPEPRLVLEPQTSSPASAPEASAVPTAQIVQPGAPEVHAVEAQPPVQAAPVPQETPAAANVPARHARTHRAVQPAAEADNATPPAPADSSSAGTPPKEPPTQDTAPDKPEQPANQP
jgi:hypothetical protein